jgi:hypothetical protein
MAQLFSGRKIQPASSTDVVQAFRPALESRHATYGASARLGEVGRPF